MTHPVRNTRGKNSTSEGIRCIFAFLLLTLFLFECPSGLRANDDRQGPVLLPSSSRTLKDLEIVARIRQAFRKDAQLRTLNLSVDMCNGVASISGPVPSAELKKRAIVLTQHMEGVFSVNAKDLYISTADQEGKRLAIVIPEEKPIQTRSASPGSPSAVLKSFDSRPVAGNGPQITLREPVSTPPSARTSPAPKLRDSRPDGARLTANPHPASPAASISLALEQLRRREARYQQIRVRVEDTTVFVFPGDTSSEDAMSFAQAVRRLPGVEHVILSSGPR